MTDKNMILRKGGLEIELCASDPDAGYYRGTRFDHTGVFRRVSYDGYVFADEWFDSYDPYKHDAVCGPSEEFAQSGYDDASVGGLFLKPGVGLLVREDDAAYDHFRLYRVADYGRMTVRAAEDRAEFCHEISGDGWGYIYNKEIRLMDGHSFEIVHRLENTGRRILSGETYNHNFFTFGPVGKDVRIDFPFAPYGTWRSDYDCVALCGDGIRFSRSLQSGESVFMGRLRPVGGGDVIGKVFCQSGFLADGGDMSKRGSVTFCSDRPFDHITFWSNHRVACIEPFIPYNIGPGESLSWVYSYLLSAH